ncbi:MAG: hypothetical protein ACI9W6_001932 [Motiliproteus sp.]
MRGRVTNTDAGSHRLIPLVSKRDDAVALLDKTPEFAKAEETAGVTRDERNQVLGYIQRRGEAGRLPTAELALERPDMDVATPP